MSNKKNKKKKEHREDDYDDCEKGFRKGVLKSKRKKDKQIVRDMMIDIKNGDDYDDFEEGEL